MVISYQGVMRLFPGGSKSMKIQERIHALQRRMQALQVDMVAIGPTANMRYLLGFLPHPDERLCLLLVEPDRTQMVVPALNAADIATQTEQELVSWTDAEGPAQALRKSVSKADSPRILAVDGAMRADFLIHLQNLVQPEKVIPLESLIAPLRLRKSPDEIQALTRAAEQADRAMQAGVDACQPGITEAEVAWAVESAFRQDGAEIVDFTLIASGPNGAYPHHHAGARPMQRGDAIILDIGATLEGYKSDITRMVYLGSPTAEFLRAFDSVSEANQRARAAVRVGRTADDVDTVARGILEQAGYGQYFTHRTGHGLGLEGHEPPWIMAGDRTELEEGMVFSIEPGVYLAGQFGVRVEDIVTVTKAGAHTLTGFDHALIIKD
jgi:Xaa-Pro aminopeptidase